ncbi:hypothetical protein [Aestuariicoccus sp. MJ-SS9]|uniref:hypothetical protein n=1 Tax=Aestuariicoccus sp. MJ-SS9 TaxID=3079855 RepID=UPI002910F2E7|nr:hypothetical protein [Aestuariicoccus sp. MJ-SS9]MDU8913346.1 hypothetical protein [Aestuariicoccus sp. MJ-SS9]
MFPVQFASALIAIFTAIIGFYVTTVVEEIRSGVAIVYSLERSQQTSRLKLYNASRTATVTNLKVAMKCVEDDQSGDCFVVDENGLVNVSPRFFAPIAAGLDRSSIFADASAIQAVVALSPGARIELSVASNPANKSGLLFVNFPATAPTQNADQSGAPETGLHAIAEALRAPKSAQRTPVFLSGSSITGRMVEHYFTTVAWAMVAASILLALTTCFWLVSSFMAVFAKKETKDDADQAPAAFIFIRGPSGSGGAGHG